MTTDQRQVATIIEDVKAHWMTRRGTVRALTRLTGVRQSDIADALGMTRQSLNGRMTGAIMFQPWELAGIAVLLDMPRDVLDLEPEQAVRWVLDNHPEKLRDF